jgi:hypothetical protein
MFRTRVTKGRHNHKIDIKLFGCFSDFVHGKSFPKDQFCGSRSLGG